MNGKSVGEVSHHKHDDSFDKEHATFVVHAGNAAGVDTSNSTCSRQFRD